MEAHEIKLLKAVTDALKEVPSATAFDGYKLENIKFQTLGGLAGARKVVTMDLTRPSGRTSKVNIDISIGEDLG